MAVEYFREKYFPFSNFSNHRVYYGGNEYATSEHAFQAAKATNETDRAYVAAATSPTKAKRRGREIACRSDWDEVKDTIMLHIVYLKVLQNEDVRLLLLGTGEEELIEGNWWKDDYWGKVKRNGKWEGRNVLGRTFMLVRDILRTQAEKGFKVDVWTGNVLD